MAYMVDIGILLSMRTIISFSMSAHQ